MGDYLKQGHPHLHTCEPMGTGRTTSRHVLARNTVNCEFIPPHVAVWAGRAPTLHWSVDPPRQGLYWMSWSLGHDALTGPNPALRTLAARAQRWRMRKRHEPTALWGRGCRAPLQALLLLCIYIPAHSDFSLASAKCRLASPNCTQRHWQPHTTTLSLR